MHPLQLVEGRGLKTSEKFLQGGGADIFILVVGGLHCWGWGHAILK